MDVQNTATHEIGHLLALADLYGDLDSLKTMYGKTEKLETQKRTLESEDEEGVCWIYPAGGPKIVGGLLNSTPKGYALLQNYPNPFNPETTIRFTMPDTRSIHLAIYNISGQCVATLVSDRMPGGTHSVVWDGRDEMGRKVASGVYFYHLTAGDFTATRKMLLIR